MRIKKFNESADVDNKGVKIWSVIDMDEMEDTISFTSEMLAADYFIKEINEMIDNGDIQRGKYGNKKFEPFFDEDGNRFFTSADENKDYKKCLEFCESHDISLSVFEGELYSALKPRNKYDDDDDY